MLKLFHYFLDLCFLRRRPQDLPGATSLLFLVMFINITIGAIGVADLIHGFSAVLAATVDATLLNFLLFVLLTFRNRFQRYLQTATAIFGSGIVLGLMALPLQLVVAEGIDVGMLGSIVSMAYLLLLVWVQIVIAHILRHALDISLFLGIGLALTYSLLSGMMIQTLFLTPA